MINMDLMLKFIIFMDMVQVEISVIIIVRIMGQSSVFKLSHFVNMIINILLIILEKQLSMERK